MKIIRALLDSGFKWPTIILLVGGGLVIGSNLLSLGDALFKSNDPRVVGGDHKQVTIEQGSKRSQMVELVRPIGNYGTRFVATLQVEGEAVTLAKGSVVGQVGAGLKLADQAIGIGISDFDFWMVRESQQSTSAESRVYKVYVRFKRTQAFIFNEQAESLVGELLVRVSAPATTLPLSPSMRPLKKLPPSD